jgi:hypothetical protein
MRDHDCNCYQCRRKRAPRKPRKARGGNGWVWIIIGVLLLGIPFLFGSKKDTQSW